jgi:hypothetical protein
VGVGSAGKRWFKVSGTARRISVVRSNPIIEIPTVAVIRRPENRNIRVEGGFGITPVKGDVKATVSLPALYLRVHVVIGRAFVDPYPRTPVGTAVIRPSEPDAVHPRYVWGGDDVNVVVPRGYINAVGSYIAA